MNIGTRMLLYVGTNDTRINEYNLLELSPSKKYFKYTIAGISQQTPLWGKISDYTFVEKLVDKS
jgi:hypothetical protein